MKMKKLILLIPLLLLVGCVSSPASNPASIPKPVTDNVTLKAIQSLQSDVAFLKSQQKDLQQSLANISSNQTIILSQLKSISQTDSAVINSISNLPDRVAKLEQQYSQINQMIGSNNSSYAQYESRLLRMADMVDAFVLISGGGLKLLTGYNYMNEMVIDSSAPLGKGYGNQYLVGVMATMQGNSEVAGAKLIMAKVGNPGETKITLRPALSTGLPGLPIATFKLNMALLDTKYLTWAWANFNRIQMGPGIYFLMLEQPYSDMNNFVWLGCDMNSTGAPSLAVDSVDGGVTWVKHFGNDFGFEIWGK